MKHGVWSLYVVGLLAGLTVGCASGPEPTPSREGAMTVAEGEEEAEDEPAPREPEAIDPRRDRGAQPTMDRATAEAQSAQISNEALEEFAGGVKALARREERLIEEGRDLETRSRQASSPIERIEIREEVYGEMEAALQEEGLEFESFMQAGQIIRQNPVLIERLEAYLTAAEIEYFFGPQE